jgi:hypothetical protein
VDVRKRATEARETEIDKEQEHASREAVGPLPQPLAGDRHREFPVLHTLGSDEQIGDPADLRTLATHHQHFDTVVLIEMDTHDGEDEHESSKPQGIPHLQTLLPSSSSVTPLRLL